MAPAKLFVGGSLLIRMDLHTFKSFIHIFGVVIHVCIVYSLWRFTFPKVLVFPGALEF